MIVPNGIAMDKLHYRSHVSFPAATADRLAITGHHIDAALVGAMQVGSKWPHARHEFQ